MRYRASFDKAKILAVFYYTKDNETLKALIEKHKQKKTFHIVDKYFNFLICSDAMGVERLYAIHSPERTILSKLNKLEYVNT